MYKPLDLNLNRPPSIDADVLNDFFRIFGESTKPISLDDGSRYSILLSPELLQPLGVKLIQGRQEDRGIAEINPGENRNKDGDILIQMQDLKQPSKQEIINIFSAILCEGVNLDNLEQIISPLLAVIAVWAKTIPPETRENAILSLREELLSYIENAGTFSNITPEIIHKIRFGRIQADRQTKQAIRRVQNTVTDLIADGGDVWGVILPELEFQCSLAAFRSGTGAIRTMLKTYGILRREEELKRYENDPKTYQVFRHKLGSVEVYKLETNGTRRIIQVFPSISYTEQSEVEKDFEASFDPSFWKNAILTAPEHKKDAIRLAAVRDLLQKLHDFPWNDENRIGQNPGDIAKTGAMQCVGKSIIGHTYLKELGIVHKACLSQNHISLMVQIDGKEWDFDGTASPASLSQNIVSEKNGSFHKSANIYKNGGEFQYQSVDAELGCYFSVMLNVSGNLAIGQREKINIIERLIQSQLGTPIVGYFLALSSCYSNIGNTTQALFCIEQEKKLHPWNAQITETFADINGRNKNYIDAYFGYLQVKNPTQITQMKMQECYELIGFQHKTELSTQAILYTSQMRNLEKYDMDQALKWIELDPTNGEAWLALGRKTCKSRILYTIASFLRDGKNFR